jgi:hypothetical protein
MSSRKQFVLGVASGALLLAMPAVAQFGTAFPGFYTLPQNDFTWFWGEPNERDLGRRPDINVSGVESNFRCELTARYRVSVDMTPNEEREVERQLSTSIAFVADSVNLMNTLEYNIQLDWGRLACIKNTDEEVSEEKQQERVDRALEKAIRARERRRERDD